MNDTVGNDEYKIRTISATSAIKTTIIIENSAGIVIGVVSISNDGSMFEFKNKL